MADYRQYQYELLKIARHASYRDIPLPEQTARAFLACPRHMFTKRTRLFGSWVEINAANLEENLEFLYRDVPLALMEDQTGNVVSTISQPSFVLYMLDLLQLAAGQTVFELGTGSGWNAALMSFLVGEQGHVYTAEIIPKMARNAAENLQRLNIRNVTVIQGDFDIGLTPDILFDRVVFTAGGCDLPSFLFQQVKTDGLVLFPFKVKGGGDVLYLLRKHHDHFQAISTIDCAFVPVTGKYHIADTEPVLTEQIPGWESLRHQLVSELPFWEWGIATGGGFTYKAHPFRFFLSISEPGYFAVKKNPNDCDISSFGLWAQESLVICKDNKLLAYGSVKIRDRFLERLRQWDDLGTPGFAAFHLKVYPMAKDVTAKENQWLIKRREAQFLWTVAGHE